MWQADGVTERPVPAESAADDPQSEIDALVQEWLTVPEVAERLGVRLSDVRRMVDDRELLALRRGPSNAVHVPARFVTDEGPLATLRGTATVLSDGGMGDAEIIRWLFTPDDSLTGGSAIGALLAGQRAEVRRRAMEQAF